MSQYEDEDLPDEEEDDAEVFESLGDAPLDEDIPEDEGDAGKAPKEEDDGDQA